MHRAPGLEFHPVPVPLGTHQLAESVHVRLSAPREDLAHNVGKPVQPRLPRRQVTSDVIPICSAEESVNLEADHIKGMKANRML